MFIDNYDAVIFDMDGVIFDSERACLKVWKYLAGEKGLDNIEEVFRKCIGTTTVMTSQIIRDAYGASFDVDAYMKESSKTFHSWYDDGRLPMLPGVKELLDFLKTTNVKIGLASSTREQSVRRELTDAGLIGYFDNLTCGDMLKVSKPAPDIYLMACDNLHVLPERAIAIEDSYNGIRSAARAGMVPIMVPDMVPADEEMRTLSFVILNNLIEVKKYFQN